ncbi:secretagogin-like isoform X2 [Petromyzon marinus]|uniref:Secretagogin-like isoform X2 n=1 Tax=Petromyzon marinus TaxID=7757 RepID=A0AAJ7TF13_PETMA|nr:secretagogin-like isoform X2 [Petromyzon marinus]
MGVTAQRYDNGYIEGKELDEFFKHLLKQAGECVSDEKVETVRRNLMSIYDESADGRLHLSEVANMLLAEDESFLLIFKRASSLDNSVEFIKIWHQYDLDSSGFISASELKNFLKDLLSHHGRQVEEKKLEEYTDTMMKLFDKNKDGRLDLNDMARILSLKENYLLQFSIEVRQIQLCVTSGQGVNARTPWNEVFVKRDASQEERRRDFEKIFAHYDVSRTGVLEGPEVDGFVKDMMELVRPSLTVADLSKFRDSLLRRCDTNQDGKIQKWELALCLGIRTAHV